MVFQIKVNEHTNTKELWLFGTFRADWPADAVSDDDIIQYAIKDAVDIGRLEKVEEIRKALNFK